MDWKARHCHLRPYRDPSCPYIPNFPWLTYGPILALDMAHVTPRCTVFIQRPGRDRQCYRSCRRGS